MKILITTSSFGKFDSTPLDLCKNLNFEYTLNPYGRALTEKEALKLYVGYDAILAGTEPITRKVIEAHRHTLKIISRCGVGTDNVDHTAAKEHNIKILCTPNAPTQATAEQALTLMLCVLRKTPSMHTDLVQGVWKKQMGNLLHKKKVGIVGYGRIGKTVAKLLKIFDCEIACHDPYVKDADCKNLPLHELLAWANIITLHCSKEKNTPALMGEKEFSLMQKGSWFINVARGELVDEQALYVALKNNHLAGAGVDVFRDEPYKGSLSQLENIVLTPHVSSYAKEARIEMELQAMQNLLNTLRV